MTIPGPDQIGDPWQERWTWNHQVPPRWLLVGDTGTPQFPDEVAVALCVDIIGLFEDLPPLPRERLREPDHRLAGQMILVGCRPEPPLLAAIAALPQSTKAALRRRRISAQVGAVHVDGTAVRLMTGVVCGTLAACAPSVLGDPLLDVTIDSDVREPVPTGMRSIVDLWFTGRPSRRNLWADYDRTLRHVWAGVALAHHRNDLPDQAKGTVFDLDGRFVTDIEGFYCALGEAINGPGGYFGWNLNALNDCLRGRWGAQPPFRLTWHNAAVAREHLVTGYDRHLHASAVTMDDLLHMLAKYHVEAELR